MFANASEGRPEAAFRIVNEPKKDWAYIQYLVRSGYYVRTRADADTKEARTRDYTRWRAALISGALAGFGVAALSPQLIDLLRWGRTLDTSRAVRELGFRPARDTLAALDEYVQQRRVLQFQPSRGTYLYDRELEDYIHARRLRRQVANGARLRLAEQPRTESEPAARAPRPRPRR